MIKILREKVGNVWSCSEDRIFRKKRKKEINENRIIEYWNKNKPYRGECFKEQKRK